EDALGRQLAELFRPLAEQTPQPLPDVIARVLASGAEVPLPEGATLVGPAGERSIEGLGTPLVDDEGRLLRPALAFRDVGEQRRLRQQVVMADRLSSLGTLASGMAHEINNPLTAVIANAGYISNALAGIRREVRASVRPEEVVARIADQLDPLLHV